MAGIMSVHESLAIIKRSLGEALWRPRPRSDRYATAYDRHRACGIAHVRRTARRRRERRRQRFLASDVAAACQSRHLSRARSVGRRAIVPDAQARDRREISRAKKPARDCGRSPTCSRATRGILQKKSRKVRSTTTAATPTSPCTLTRVTADPHEHLYFGLAGLSENDVVVEHDDSMP